MSLFQHVATREESNSWCGAKEERNLTNCEKCISSHEWNRSCLGHAQFVELSEFTRQHSPSLDHTTHSIVQSQTEYLFYSISSLLLLSIGKTNVLSVWQINLTNFGIPSSSVVVLEQQSSLRSTVTVDTRRHVFCGGVIRKHCLDCVCLTWKLILIILSQWWWLKYNMVATHANVTKWPNIAKDWISNL